VPGRADALGINRHTGVLVFTHVRVYALLPTVPRIEGPLIDARWDAQAEGPGRITIDAEGMTLDVPLKEVDPRFTGDLAMAFRTALTDEVLNELPTRSLHIPVSPENVFRLLGVRVRN
jgi:hypothetical protein